MKMSRTLTSARPRNKNSLQLAVGSGQEKIKDKNISKLKVERGKKRYQMSDVRKNKKAKTKEKSRK